MSKQHETPTIQVNERDRTGSAYSRRLRRNGQLPAVIYGHKRDPVHVSVDAKEILSLIRHGAHVLSLQVGKASTAETCLVKDLQFGFMGDNVVHIDFARVSLDEEVEVNVHLNFVGTPVGAQKPGAILSHDLTGLEVICRVDAIPEEIKVDLTIMGEETVLTVGQLTLPPGVRAVADASAPVSHISFVKKEEEVVGEEAEVVATEEPEVITEGKEEEDGKKKPQESA